MDVVNEIEVLETDVKDCNENANVLIVLLYMIQLCHHLKYYMI